MADEEEARAKKGQSLMQCRVLKETYYACLFSPLLRCCVYILVHVKDLDRILVVTLNELMNLKMSIIRLL